MATMIDPVEVKFLTDLSQMKRDMEQMKQIVGTSAGAAAKSLGGMETALANLGRTAAGMVGVGSIGAFLGAAHTAALEAQKSQQQLSGALKATGHAAGLTRGEIEGLVEELEGTTAFDDEALREAAAAMLRFRDVQGETFKEGLRLAPDLAAALQTNVVDAARSIGRALQDPAHGLRGLKTAGIELSEQQIDLAEKLSKTGDKAAAAKIVIDALTKSVGGQAAESNQGLVGSTAAAKKAWDELLESVGNVPQNITGTSFIDRLTEKLRMLKVEVEGGSGSVRNWMSELIGLRRPGEQAGREQQERAAAEASEQAEKARAAEGAKRQRSVQEENAAYERRKEAEKAATEAAKRQRQEYDNLIKSLREKTAASALELDAGETLTAGQKEAMRIMVGLRDGTLKLTEAQKIAVAAELEMAISNEKGVAAKKEAEKAQKEYTDAVRAHFDPLEKQLAGLAEENEFHGKLASAIEDVKAQRIEEAAALAAQNGASADHIEFLKREADLRRGLAGELRQKEMNKKLDEDRKKQEQEWERTAENIERSLTDALMRGFEGGKDMGKNLRDTLYNMFRTLVLQPMIKPVAEGMSKSITGAIEGLFNNIGGNAWAPSEGLDFFVPSAQGNVFAAPGLNAYANRVINRPTIFPFARGVGLMGEKPGSPGEAIMPLERMSGGDLGVKVQGAGNTFIINVPPGTAPEIRRAAGQGAREAVAALGRARRYA